MSARCKKQTLAPSHRQLSQVRSAPEVAPHEWLIACDNANGLARCDPQHNDKPKFANVLRVSNQNAKLRRIDNVGSGEPAGEGSYDRDCAAKKYCNEYRR